MVVLNELNERSREVFRHIVEAFVSTGEPIGSRTVSRRLSAPLSPATIRNVMADLEEAGLLYSPHTSAGRLPTESGLRLFVDGLLEIGNLTADERATIASDCAKAGRNVDELLSEASGTLSELSSCAGVVLAPKYDAPLKHVEFVSLAPGRAMVVMVGETGSVENRVVTVPAGMSPATLTQAANYLNARLAGHTLEEALTSIRRDLEEHRSELDELTKRVVELGLASWAGGDAGGNLIVRGHANLLKDVTAVSDLERIRSLFDLLETKQDLARLVELTQGADGVKIFIGAESELFGLTNCAMVVAPLAGGQTDFVGAIGVIGPTRLNYARIIPMVDYTAEVVGRLLGYPREVTGNYGT